MKKLLLIIGISIFPWFGNAVTKAVLNYSGTNVTTSAYVQLVASLSESAERIEVFDSSGQSLVLALGAGGSEVDKFYILPGGNGSVKFFIPSGTRVSLKAVSGTASTGSIYINFYPNP